MCLKWQKYLNISNRGVGYFSVVKDILRVSFVSFGKDCLCRNREVRYTFYMPITSEMGKKTEEGIEKDSLIVTFTNGAKDQLAELQEYYKSASELEVIKLGISYLQRIKEIDETNKDAAVKK